MDALRGLWYEPCMSALHDIPTWQLFGETSAFPDVVHCERIGDRAPRHDWSIPPHRHARMVQAVQVLSGSAEAVLDGAHHRMAPGDFVYMPAQCVHGFRFSHGTEGLVASWPLAVVLPLLDASGGLAQRLSRPMFATASDLLAGLFLQFDAAYGQTGTFRTPLLVSLSRACLSGIAEHGASGPPPGPASAVLSRFDALLQTHRKDGWTAGDYAAALGVSTGHLSRICRAARGTGARGCIDAHVMEEAARMLAFTRLPVAEIGYRLGYDDPPHFSRRFRVLRGEAPTAYRQRFASAPLP
ncbi:helix-turn-helix domain-containing protein [Salipiger sp.]|uniref:helix-turn-helix domain-containing protein n=1 Tax=Salipiger sp. TaxID=2078585 RepID=UPI003A96AF92